MNEELEQLKKEVAELAAHTHAIAANAGGSTGDCFPNNGYSSTATIQSASTGGDQPHNNLQPYITLNYIIKAL